MDERITVYTVWVDGFEGPSFRYRDDAVAERSRRERSGQTASVTGQQYEAVGPQFVVVNQHGVTLTP